MRHRQGDMLYETDGEGNEYQTMITNADNKAVEASIINKNRKAHETMTNITLAQSIIKGSNTDFVIEKATKLGVAQITPIKTERTIAAVSDKKLNRYEKLMLDAIKSSTRIRLPSLSKPILFNKLLETTDNYDLTLITWEAEKTNRLTNVTTKERVNNILLIIGPDGGFTESEIAEATRSGANSFTLGPRRLRAETAALAALSLVLYKLKEM